MRSRALNRVAVALVGVVLAVAPACSDDDGALSGSPSSSASTTPSTSTSTSSPAPSSSSASSTTTPAPAATTAPGPATTGTSSPAAAVAEAGGWRLVLTAPRGGSTIRPLAVLCYELSGTSREPEVALEVALLQPGSTTVVRTASAQGMVGRQSAQVDLSGLPAGPYDLRVQMIVNGERLPGGNVTLRNVRVAADGPETVCA